MPKQPPSKRRSEPQTDLLLRADEAIETSRMLQARLKKAWAQAQANVTSLDQGVQTFVPPRKGR